MKPVLLILLFTSFACSEPNQNKEQSSLTEDMSATAPQPEMPSRKDSVFKDLSLTSYSPLINFGMGMSEWNKALASQAREGYFKSIDDKGEARSYAGFRSSGANDKSGYWLYPVFTSSEEQLGPGKVRIYRFNGKYPGDRFLSGVKYLFTFNGATEINRAIREMISENGLQYAIGNRSLDASDNPPVKEDFSFQNDFEKTISPDKKRQSGEWKECGYSYTGVYDNARCYYVFKVTNQGRARVYLDADGDIYAIADAISFNNLEVAVHSKALSGIDITEYATLEQKNQMKDAEKSKTLIDKALSD